MAINETFGAAVRKVLDGHGLSLRQTRIRTGIDIDTVSRMREGDVPRLDKIVAFARGMKLDVNEWLVLAGYEPVPPNPRDHWLRLMGELALACRAEKVELPEPPSFHGGVENQTPEQLEMALELMLGDLGKDYPDRIGRIREAMGRYQ